MFINFNGAFKNTFGHVSPPSPKRKVEETTHSGQVNEVIVLACEVQNITTTTTTTTTPTTTTTLHG